MSNSLSSPLSMVLEQIDGVTDLTEKLLTGKIGEKRYSVMNIFKFNGASYSSLFIKSDEVCGINLRVSYSYNLTQKKTRTQILNDINTFNYKRIGAKVVLKEFKDNTLHLNFDCEMWVNDNTISKGLIEANIKNLMVSPSFFNEDFNYLGK